MVGILHEYDKKSDSLKLASAYEHVLYEEGSPNRMKRLINFVHECTSACDKDQSGG